MSAKNFIFYWFKKITTKAATPIILVSLNGCLLWSSGEDCLIDCNASTKASGDCSFAMDFEAELSGGSSSYTNSSTDFCSIQLNGIAPSELSKLELGYSLTDSIDGVEEWVSVSTSDIVDGDLSSLGSRAVSTNALINGSPYYAFVKASGCSNTIELEPVALTGTCTLDTALNLTVTSPSAGSISASSFNLAGNCETGSTVYIEYSDDSEFDTDSSPATMSCTNGSYSGTITLAGSSGARSLNVTQTDAAGNTASETVSFQYEPIEVSASVVAIATNPNTVSGLPLMGTCSTNVDTISVSYLLKDSSGTTVSGPTTVTLDDSDCSDGIWGKETFSYAGTVGENRYYEFTVTATDSDSGTTATDTQNSWVCRNWTTISSSTPSGAGTSGDPYLITSAEELLYARSSSSEFKLMNNIDLACKTNSSGTSWAGDFSGVFNGNGYTISNGYIDQTWSHDGGLFSTLSNGATVKNLTLKGWQIISRTPGILARRVATGSVTIQNVKAYGVSNSTLNAAGGLIGSIETGTGLTLKAPVFHGTINTPGGGLIGITAEERLNNITIEPDTSVAGSTRYTDVAVWDNANHYSQSYSGGLIGYHYGWGTLTVSKANIRFRSFKTTATCGGGSCGKGGIIGYVSNSVGTMSLSQISALVNVYSPTWQMPVGGFIGYNAKDGGTTIQKSYIREGSVISVGPSYGLIGGFIGAGYMPIFTQNYSYAELGQYDGTTVGNVNSGNNGNIYVGGYTGSSTTYTGVASSENYYWNNSGRITHEYSGGTGNVPNKSTAQLTTASTFQNWDNSVWDIVDGELPTLSFENE